MREEQNDGRAGGVLRFPRARPPMRRCAWAQGAGRTLLVALVALASKSVADERHPVARCSACPPRPALARRTATILNLAQHPCLTLRGGGRSRRDQAARGGSQKGSREGGHNGRAEARNDESAAPSQSVDQVMREDQSRSSTHAPGKHQPTSIADLDALDEDQSRTPSARRVDSRSVGSPFLRLRLALRGGAGGIDATMPSAGTERPRPSRKSGRQHLKVKAKAAPGTPAGTKSLGSAGPQARKARSGSSSSAGHTARDEDGTASGVVGEDMVFDMRTAEEKTMFDAAALPSFKEQPADLVARDDDGKGEGQGKSEWELYSEKVGDEEEEQPGDDKLLLPYVSSHAARLRAMMEKALPALVRCPMLQGSTSEPLASADELMRIFDRVQGRDSAASDLIAGAATNDEELLDHLLVAGTVSVDCRDACSMTPLMHAAMEGSLEAACVLLQHGADTEARDDEGWTALHYAAQAGYPLLVEVLLRAGANPDVYAHLPPSKGGHYGGQGASPLHLARR